MYSKNKEQNSLQVGCEIFLRYSFIYFSVIFNAFLYDNLLLFMYSRN